MSIDDPYQWPTQVRTIGAPGLTRDPLSTATGLVVATKGGSDGRPSRASVATVNAVDTSKTVALRHLARVVRSKNSGPFEITLDVMFTDAGHYARVKEAGVLSMEMVMRLYSVARQDVVWEGWFEPALAWKCTIKRPWRQGSVGERDTLGTAQHAPLLDIQVPARA